MSESTNLEQDASAKDQALIAAVRIAVGAFSARPQPDVPPTPADT